MEYPCGGGSGVSSHPQPSAVFSSVHRKPRSSEITPAEARDAAVRAAKKHLREIVRDDWTYEPSSSSSLAKANNNSGSSRALSPPLSPTRTVEVQEWREREPDTSCSDTEGGVSGATAVLSPSPGEEGFPRSGSPDAAERRLAERRAKRRRLMEEEMQWNDGLRTFVERRDVWSGAQVNKGKKRPAALRKASSKTTDELPRDIAGDGQIGNGNRSSTGTEDVEMVDHGSCLSSSLPSATADTSITTAPDLQHDDSSFTPLQPETKPREEEEEEEQGALEDDTEVLIPVLPSIIPLSNPVRASIDSSIYPSIYSKVVVQSLTPTIPINLSDMTKCLVQGWKADGQWPPQGTAQDPLAARRKPAVAQYEIMGAGGKDQANEPPATATTATPPPTTMRQKRGSGVGDTVRKVLNFPLPFHLRRGSQAAAEQPGSPDAIRNS